MNVIILTPTQRDLIRHAIGFDGRSKTTYRNHFVTGPGSEDYPHWMDLVEKGYALRYPLLQLSGGDEVFTVTRETALAVREPDEHLSREFR